MTELQRKVINRWYDAPSSDPSDYEIKLLNLQKKFKYNKYSIFVL